MRIRDPLVNFVTCIWHKVFKAEKPPLFFQPIPNTAVKYNSLKNPDFSHKLTDFECIKCKKKS